MPKQDVLRPERLAQKVRWEGGLLGALSYGIHAEEIEDSELRTRGVVWNEPTGS